MLCLRCAATVEVDTRYCPHCGEETGARAETPPVWSDAPPPSEGWAPPPTATPSLDDAPEWAVTVAQDDEAPPPDIQIAHASLTEVHPVSVPEPSAVSPLARWLGIVVLLAVVMAVIVKMAIAYWVVGTGTRMVPENKSGPKTNARPPIVVAA